MRKDKLKELEIAMMRNEIYKMEVDIQYHEDKRKYGIYGINRATICYNSNVLIYDNIGYKLSFEFERLKNELLKNEEISMEEYIQYKNSSLISAKNVLNDYDLYYKDCYTFTINGIEYSSPSEIDKDYIEVTSKINDLYTNAQLSTFEKERLDGTCKFLYDTNKLLLQLNKKDNELSLKK